jgi:hypothetical protein
LIVGMLAFTLIRAVGPDHFGCADKIHANGNRAIRPCAGPWRSSSTEDRVAAQQRRFAVMHVNLTVEVSVAASELLASWLVPKPAGVENLAVSMTWAARDAVPTGEAHRLP